MDLGCVKSLDAVLVQLSQLRSQSPKPLEIQTESGGIISAAARYKSAFFAGLCWETFAQVDVFRDSEGGLVLKPEFLNMLLGRRFEDREPPYDARRYELRST